MKYHYDIIGQDNHSFYSKIFPEKKSKQLDYFVHRSFNFGRKEIMQRDGNSNIELEKKIQKGEDNLPFLRLFYFIVQKDTYMKYHSCFHFFDLKISLEKNQNYYIMLDYFAYPLILIRKKLCNVMEILAQNQRKIYRGVFLRLRYLYKKIRI